MQLNRRHRVAIFARHPARSVVQPDGVEQHAIVRRVALVSVCHPVGRPYVELHVSSQELAIDPQHRVAEVRPGRARHPARVEHNERAAGGVLEPAATGAEPPARQVPLVRKGA